jgi:hypothetical protein
VTVHDIDIPFCDDACNLASDVARVAKVQRHMFERLRIRDLAREQRALGATD